MPSRYYMLILSYLFKRLSFDVAELCLDGMGRILKIVSKQLRFPGDVFYFPMKRSRVFVSMMRGAHQS